MKTVDAVIGKWFVQCIPEDGARISVLQYEGIDLLTSCPPVFKPPGKNYGEYETRPVYGYDDCFPSVDPCKYPVENLECRDHGNLCWMKWQVKLESNKLICQADCFSPKAIFKRTLEFIGNRLIWRFEVLNLSDSNLAFLHVMHALMPLKEIQSLELPGFFKIINESTSTQLYLTDTDEVVSHLLNIQPGAFEMLLLKGVRQGQIGVGLKKGVTVKIDYNIDLFPTIGIWWNNSGYPDEDGLRRNECAFEPIPGSSSNLERSFREGIFLEAEPGKTLSWAVKWEIEKK
jgi:hypothetical protein